MKFSTLTLIFAVSITVAFLGTVNSSLRVGSVRLILAGILILVGDGIIDYIKARNVTAFASAGTLISLVILASILGISLGG